LLAKWQEQQGLTQTDAAKALKLTQGTFSRLIRGDSLPRIDTAIAIERLTGVPVSAWAA
jgi:transcriptional regulator with XRE-family HTH domain